MIKKGDEIIVKVTGIKEYGIFFEYHDYTGLVHISELSEKFIKRVADFFKKNDKVMVKVLSVDYDNKKISASYKAIKKRRINRYFDIGYKTIEDNYQEIVNKKIKEIRRDE